MRDFLDYLYDRKRILIGLMVILGAFAIVYFAYEIRGEAYLYALVISLVLTAIIGLFDYHRYREELDSIRRLKDQWDMELLVGRLGANARSREYQRVIRLASDKLLDQASKSQLDLQAMEEFFIMWTHQIKLPISAINLYLDSNDQVNKSVIKGQMKRINQYSDMVMAFVRLESDKSDLVIEEHDLNTIIKDSIKEFKLDFINKGLSLIYEPVNRKLITDKKWFSFALEQIMSNALKYTKSGYIKVFIDKDNLVVEDTGIGIKNEDMPRVFDKGYTGYNGRVNAEASGLGLYLVKRTLDKLNHKIYMESELDKGTKVYISLERYDLKAE